MVSGSEDVVCSNVVVSTVDAVVSSADVVELVVSLVVVFASEVVE